MKISAKKMGQKSARLFNFLAERSFGASLCFILLALVIGGILFYKYDIQLNEAVLSPQENLTKIKSQDYQKIIDYWQEMQNNFDSADSKNYLNPFLEGEATTSSGQNATPSE